MNQVEIASSTGPFCWGAENRRVCASSHLNTTFSDPPYRRAAYHGVIEELVEKRYLGKMRQPRQRRVSCGVSGAEFILRSF